MRRNSGHRWMLALALTFSVCVGGCASWTDRSTPERADSPLVPLRENSRTASLEFQFVPIVMMKAAAAIEPEIPVQPEIALEEAEAVEKPLWAMSPSDPDSVTQHSTEQLLQSLWQWVDETGIAPDLRRRLSDNGLRVGRILDRERFTSRLQLLSPDSSRVEEFLQQADVASDTAQGRQRIPMRTGRRYELPLRQPVRGPQVTLVRWGDETVGKSLVDAQYLFAVTVSPSSAAGELRVKLQPEIQHGSMKQTWVSSDSALRIDTRRSVWSLEPLEIELVGSEGDLFVVSSLDAEAGLGPQMFLGTTSDGAPQHTLLLIRLANVPTSIDRL